MIINIRAYSLRNKLKDKIFLSIIARESNINKLNLNITIISRISNYIFKNKINEL